MYLLIQEIKLILKYLYKKLYLYLNQNIFLLFHLILHQLFMLFQQINKQMLFFHLLFIHHNHILLMIYQ